MRSLRVHAAFLRAAQRAAVASALVFSACSAGEVSITIHLIDAASGERIPARLEVTDSKDRSHLSNNAIPVTLECLLSPLPAWLAPLQTSSGIFNPYTGTTQFYADGTAELSLPPGRYRLRVAKGLEWRRRERKIKVNQVVPNSPGRVRQHDRLATNGRHQPNPQRDLGE